MTDLNINRARSIKAEPQLYHPPHYEMNTWHKPQLFVSIETANGIASGGVVPNINDLVISWDGNRKIEERVTFVDPITHKSTLEPVEYPKSGNGLTTGVGIGVGNLANVAYLYLNPSDPKLGVEVDYRLPQLSIYGSTLSYAKIYLDSDIGPNGQVVSVSYDSLGNVKNDRIPVVMQDIYNDDTRRYIVRPGSVDVMMPEGTLCTLCLYNDVNVMVSYQTLEVKHNGLISSLATRTLYVNRVYLDTPYINPANEFEILIPKNLLANSFMPRVFKEYSTGSREELFVGTSNVSLFGWTDGVNGSSNETFPLVLNYVLGRHERSESVNQHSGKHITTNYTVRVVGSDAAVDVKLFVLPTYNTETSSYDLKFYLYNGQRSMSKEVTSRVTYQGYVGNKFGTKQTIDFSIDLAEIEDTPDIIYADTIDLTLMNEPMATSTMYRLWYYQDPSRWFGEHLRIKLLNHFNTRTIDVANGFSQKAEWLEHMFYRAAPLYDSSVSNEAPAPTYVDITVNGRTITIDIETYWNGETPWNSNVVMSNGDNVVLVWYTHSDNGSRLELAITNLPLEVI